MENATGAEHETKSTGPGTKGGAAVIKRNRYQLVGLILGILYHIVRGYSCTFRLHFEHEKPWLDHLQCGGRVLLCGWHQQFFAAICHFKNYQAYRPALMISQRRDGDIIAGITEKSGWHAVDGGRALKEMTKHLECSGLAAHIVDGPRGPLGIVILARATGAVVVPIYTAADRAWYFRSWDRFMLPKPFARVHLRFCEMLDLNAGGSDEAFENQRLRLEQIMLPGLISCRDRSA